MIQFSPALGDQQRNLKAHLDQVHAAVEQGADLVVFPELSLTGYFVRDMVPDLALSADSPELRPLIEASSRAAVVFGFVEESPQNHFYNAAVFADGGQVVHLHRKVYLPTYGLFDEQRYFAAGHRIQAFSTERFGRVGLLLCEDFWQISTAAIMQAEEVDLLVCVANSPGRGVASDKFQTAETYDHFTKAVAQMIGAVVVLVNRVGFEDGLCFWGGSRAVGPDGRILAEAPMLDECITLAEFDPREIRRQQTITPLARDQRLLVTIEEFNRIRRQRYGA